MSAAHEARDVPGIDYITPPMSAAHEARDVPHTHNHEAGGRGTRKHTHNALREPDMARSHAVLVWLIWHVFAQVSKCMRD